MPPRKAKDSTKGSFSTEETTSGEGYAAAEPITGVLRSLALLEAMASNSSGLTFAEIVTLLSVNKGIALKIVNSLLVTRYIYRDDSAGVFRLTFKLSNLGMRKTEGAGLLRQVAPILRQYADETDELVRLAVVEDDTLTWVMSIPGKQSLLQINPHYSYEIKLHLHAAGRAWLSTLPIERAMSLIEAAGMSSGTKHFANTPEAIKKELLASRKRGYALNLEEYSLGVGAIGAPIVIKGFGAEPECVGVVTVAAPSVRMSRVDFQNTAPRLIEVTSQLADVWPLDSGSLKL